MTIKLLLRWVFAISAMICLIGGGLILYYWPTTLTIAVGPGNSTLAAYVSEIDNALAIGKESFRLKIVLTSGSQESSKLLNAKKVDLAVLRSDDETATAARALVVLQRKSMFVIARLPQKPAPKPATKAPAKSVATPKGAKLAGVQTDKPTAKASANLPAKETTNDAIAKAAPKTVVKQSAKLTKKKSAKTGDADGDEKEAPGFLDLLGKVRGAMLNRSGSNDIPAIIEAMQHYGREGDARKLRVLDLKSAVAAFKANQIDLLIFLAHPSEPAIRDLFRSVRKSLVKQFLLLSLPGPKGLAYQLKHLESSTLPAGVFGGSPTQPAEEMESVAVTYELVATPRLGERDAALLTKTLTDLRTQLRGSDDGEFTIELPSVEEPRRYLPHAGVVAQINGESKSFLEQNSELLWLGLFVAGGLGSIFSVLLAWLGIGRRRSSI